MVEKLTLEGPPPPFSSQHLVISFAIFSRQVARNFFSYRTRTLLELRSFLTRKDRDADYEMADRRPSGVKEIMRSTWSWACRPRDRCPRSAIYTPGYPAVEEGPSLPMGLPRRPPVVPDGNRAHPSARNQMSCHAVRPFPYRVKKEIRVLSFFLSLFERGATDRSMILSARWLDDTGKCRVSMAFRIRSLSTNPQIRSSTTRR